LFLLEIVAGLSLVISSEARNLAFPSNNEISRSPRSLEMTPSESPMSKELLEVYVQIIQLLLQKGDKAEELDRSPRQVISFTLLRVAPVP